jgi:dUTP pyrophosphatase
MRIYVKNIEGLTLPQKGSKVSAGYDIIATSEPKIVGESNKNAKEELIGLKRIDYIEYETNLYIAPSPVTFHTLIHPRSSISKYNLILANSVGLVDNDYRGMVICRFKYIWQPEDFIWGSINDKEANISRIVSGYINPEKIYKKGDKIAQLVFEPTVQVEFELVDDLNNTERGEGGFGSTDLNPETPIMLPENKVEEKGSLKTLYTKAGGIPIKKRYGDEMRGKTPP